VGDWLYLIGPEGVAHPIRLTTPSEEILLLPHGGVALDNVEMTPTQPGALQGPGVGEFFISEGTLRVAVDQFQYQVNVGTLPVEDLEALPDGNEIASAREVFGAVGVVTMAPVSESPVTFMPDVPLAGNVLVPEGSNFVGNQFVAGTGMTTVSDWVYLVDMEGLLRPIQLTPAGSTMLADLPIASMAITNVFKIEGTRQPGASEMVMMEGNFFVSDGQLMVAHEGFAYPISVQTFSETRLSDLPDGEAITTVREAEVRSAGGPAGA
jgi:hypothetical protein